MDELLMKVEGTQTVYYHEDRLGSTTHLTDASGNVVERYRYNPFGSPFIRNAEGWGSRIETAYNNRFLYTGREWLAKIGIYDYRNRAYSPNLGRFMQPDPIGFDARDVNIYRYVGNNAVNARDPDGLEEDLCAGPKQTADRFARMIADYRQQTNIRPPMGRFIIFAAIPDVV